MRAAAGEPAALRGNSFRVGQIPDRGKERTREDGLRLKPRHLGAQGVANGNPAMIAAVHSCRSGLECCSPRLVISLKLLT